MRMQSMAVALATLSLAWIPLQVGAHDGEIHEESELTPEGNVRQAQPKPERDKLKKLAASPQLDLFARAQTDEQELPAL